MEERSTICIGGENSSICGYCKSSSNTSISFGFFSEKMYSDDYDALLVKGWRRCGTHFYKPINNKTCCPAYTIRLNVLNFKIAKSQKQVLRKFERYLQTGDIHEKPTEPTPREILLPINYQIETVPPEFTEERYQLYREYQINVHGDTPEKLTKEGFINFLVTSPLINRSIDLKSSGFNWGSYHQLHRLNEKLIAVGVVDLLPSGLSSVYLFYHPDYRQLVLGKLTALKEIEFCVQEGLPFYYMGFYIHSCPKMRYKAEYTPSELLCPSSFTWHDWDRSKALLDACSFTPLDPSLAEEWISLRGDDPHCPIPLKFLPQYPSISESTLGQSSLLIGPKQEYFLMNFNPRVISNVARILREFEKHCDSSLFSHFSFKLYN